MYVYDNVEDNVHHNVYNKTHETKRMRQNA